MEKKSTIDSKPGPSSPHFAFLTDDENAVVVAEWKAIVEESSNPMFEGKDGHLNELIRYTR